MRDLTDGSESKPGNDITLTLASLVPWAKARDKLDLWVASPSDLPLAERKLPSHVCVYVICLVMSDSL